MSGHHTLVAKPLRHKTLHFRLGRFHDGLTLEFTSTCHNAVGHERNLSLKQ